MYRGPQHGVNVGGAEQMYQRPPYVYASPQGAPPYAAYGPQVGYYYSMPPGHLEGDQPRTIFLTGFPADVRQRELANMLRFLPGFEACHMEWRAGGAHGFGLFSSPAAAVSALKAVSSAPFDEGVVLRAEMARKNLAPLGVGGGAAGGYAAAGAYSPGGARGSPPLEGAPAAPPALPPPPAAHYGHVGHAHHHVVPAGYALPAAGYGPYAAPPPPVLVGGGPPHGAATPPLRAAYAAPPAAPLPGGGRDNPPCNTLFVGNLCEGVDPSELTAVFGRHRGYQQLKVVRGPKGVSCFIEFADVGAAAECHAAQQGALLPSAGRGGIRVQFSKNPFGRKRDGAHGAGYAAGYGGDGTPPGAGAVGYGPAGAAPPTEGDGAAPPGLDADGAREEAEAEAAEGAANGQDQEAGHDQETEQEAAADAASLQQPAEAEEEAER